MELGIAIRKIRKHIGLSQGELSQMCAISQTALSQIESGTKYPSERTIKKLCKVLGIPESLIYILGMNDKDVPPSKAKVYQMAFPLIQELTWQMIPQGEFAELRPD
jgi:transcriptional regulator with XRE-family HTH domain